MMFPRPRAALVCTLAAAALAFAGCARPSRILETGLAPASSRRVPATTQEAIDRGLGFLLAAQNPDGSWGTGTVTYGNETESWVPGSHDAFRVGATSLCTMALREALHKMPGNDAVRAAHARAVDYLATQSYARRDDGMLLYNIWAHIYALQALSAEIRNPPPPAPSSPSSPSAPAAHTASAPAADLRLRLQKMAEWHLERLVRYQTVEGGWNYYDFRAQTRTPSMSPTSFSTAAGLVALWEARQAGLEVPQDMVDRCLRRLRDMRQPSGAYLYAADGKFRPRQPANQLQGSIGRIQACNLTLWLWADPAAKGKPFIGPPEVRQGLDDLIRYHPFIDMGRKRPIPHEAWYQTAGYYYYFGHYYAGRLVEKLGPDTAGKDYLAAVRGMVLNRQEDNGSWWDFIMWDYGPPYGTAFALMTLLRCP